MAEQFTSSQNLNIISNEVNKNLLTTTPNFTSSENLNITSPTTTEIQPSTFTSSEGLNIVSPDTTQSINLDTSQPTKLKTDQYTNWQKIRYGIDKQNTFFGNLYRVAKAGTQAAFDAELEFKDYIQRNYNEEQRQLVKKYGNLASGAYDDDTLVQAAEMATFMADPFYLFAYLSPWGRAATATYKGLATISGATIGLDTMLDQLATTGEIDPKGVGIATVGGATLGPLSVAAFRGIAKLLPNANKTELAKVLGVIEGQKAKQLGVSVKEFQKLQSIAGDKELLAANKQILKLSKDSIKPIEAAEKSFNISEKRIDNQINKLLSDKRKIKGKGSKKRKESVAEEIAALNKKKAVGYKEFQKEKTGLWKKISKNDRKLADLEAKREYIFLKKLKAQKSLTRNTAEFVVGAALRPAFGAGIGYAFGRLWGADDSNLNNWMLAGATLGGLHKLVQRSGKVFSTGEKNFLDKIIFNEATKLSFQKVRELTAATTSTKLAAIGGDTAKIGSKLFQSLDKPFSQNSASGISDRIRQTFTNRAYKIVNNVSSQDQNAAIRIVRGSKEKGNATVNRVAKDIQKWLADFREEYTKVGIGLRKEIWTKGGKKITQRIDPIKDYFPRVWNFSEMKKDPAKFIGVVADILRKTNPGKYKKEGSAEAAAKGFYNGISRSTDEGFFNRKAVENLVQALSAGKEYKSLVPLIRGLPLSDHIAKDRILKGTYAQVEKVLEKNNYLVNEVVPTLNNLVARSADSIGFASQFGAKGQLLKPYIEGIINKYQGEKNAIKLASDEIALVMKHIDGYFGRYGKIREGIAKSGAGILSTLANLNMLERVSIASLGDLVQPFTTSNNFRSFLVGLHRTGLRAVDEKGLATELGYTQGKTLQNYLLKTITPLDNATQAKNVMDRTGTLRWINEKGFKILGLQWLTGFARRYAYNVGTVDALVSSQKLARYVSKGNNLNTAKGLRLLDDLSRYGIDVKDAIKLGKYSNLDEALKNKAAKTLLEKAGITASNRDALIPQVSNRLLFTQSRDPLTRLFGQFMSWALAKSAQTNRLLTRIENGDARTLVKLLAALPVYGGIQQLREVAKYGEVVTDIETETDKWYSEALRLSGLSGVLPELFINRLSGPGAREPWFLFAPFFSVLTDSGKVAQDAWIGDWDAALKRFMQRIAPAPIFTKWVTSLFSDKDWVTPVSSAVGNIPGMKRGGYINGGVPIPHVEEKSIIIVDDETKNRIKKHEGNKSIPYQLEYTQEDGTKVKEDFWTVGIGHKLNEKTKDIYTDEEIEKLFEQDILKASKAVDKLVDKSKIHPKAYNLLVEMAFQMGGTGLSKFKKTLKAINNNNYQEASKHMLWNYNEDGSIKGKTNWHNQTSKRAKELSALMKGLFKKRKKFFSGDVVEDLQSKAGVKLIKDFIAEGFSIEEAVHRAGLEIQHGGLPD
jgi:lysozyme